MAIPARVFLAGLVLASLSGALLCCAPSALLAQEPPKPANLLEALFH